MTLFELVLGNLSAAQTNYIIIIIISSLVWLVYFKLLSVSWKFPLLLLPTFLNCSFQFNPSSTIIPSDFVSLTRLISEPFSMSDSWDNILLVLRGCPIIMYSVFCGLILNLLILIHSEILIISSWALSKSSSVRSDVKVTWVSSAYRPALESPRQLSKSFK